MGNNAIEVFEDWLNNKISPQEKKELLKYIANNYTIKVIQEGYYTGPHADLIKGFFTGPSSSSNVCPTCGRSY